MTKRKYSGLVAPSGLPKHVAKAYAKFLAWSAEVDTVDEQSSPDQTRPISPPRTSRRNRTPRTTPISEGRCSNRASSKTSFCTATISHPPTLRGWSPCPVSPEKMD
jgi:hypothetical protein